MIQPLRFRCPTCREPLAADETGFVCHNRHRYDRAREGYVNLLPSGRLKGRPAGDSEEMVRARRTVFDAGLYGPIIAEVARAVVSARPRWILDCGCGEGAYLAAAAQASGAHGWGVDISKPAVRIAARRHRNLDLAVATSYSLPFDDASFDVALSVFSPRPYDEMMRVLVPGGTAVLVTPGADHLRELKALVYDDPRDHDEVPDVGWPTPDVRSSVRFAVALERPDLRSALLEMTPFWWSTPPERRHAIAEQVDAVTVDVRVSVHVAPDGVPADAGTSTVGG